MRGTKSRSSHRGGNKLDNVTFRRMKLAPHEAVEFSAQFSRFIIDTPRYGQVRVWGCPGPQAIEMRISRYCCSKPKLSYSRPKSTCSVSSDSNFCSLAV